MKLGKRCAFYEIEIGEVFALDGCITIAIRTGHSKIMVLAYDNDCSTMHINDWINGWIGKEIIIKPKLNGSAAIGYRVWCRALYKLPQATKNYWKENV